MPCSSANRLSKKSIYDALHQTERDQVTLSTKYEKFTLVTANVGREFKHLTDQIRKLSLSWLEMMEEPALHDYRVKAGINKWTLTKDISYNLTKYKTIGGTNAIVVDIQHAQLCKKANKSLYPTNLNMFYTKCHGMLIRYI